MIDLYPTLGDLPGASQIALIVGVVLGLCWLGLAVIRQGMAVWDRLHRKLISFDSMLSDHNRLIAILRNRIDTLIDALQSSPRPDNIGGQTGMESQRDGGIENPEHSQQEYQALLKRLKEIETVPLPEKEKKDERTNQNSA